MNGLDVSQFTTAPISLGQIELGFDITDDSLGGQAFNFSLPFTGASEAALLDSINAGTDFQLIIGAVATEDDVTFSGVGNTFDPGDPSLTITTVPEPSSALLLALGGMLGIRRRRS